MSRTIFAVLSCTVLSVLSQDCSSPRDAGVSCSDGTQGRRFYFDSRMSICQPFFFKGCNGNDNNFESAAECRAACAAVRQTGAEIRNGKQWLLAERCGAEFLIPDGKYVECKVNRDCPEQHSCADGVCCPSKDYVCSLRDDSGTFASGVEDKPRFAWSDEIQSCWRFSYFGAKGNYNNFPNFQSCTSFCANRK
uniref:Kunitz/Bovine pancreatic trypsin inhibitor domain protein n=1 Tax=Panagrellus redivivus TaxID=6233 RepID=A0A7E4UPA3_PANRE